MKRAARRPLYILLLASAFTLFPSAFAGERGAARPTAVNPYSVKGTARSVSAPAEPEKSPAQTALDASGWLTRDEQQAQLQARLQSMKSGRFSQEGELALSSIPPYLLGTWVQIEDSKELGELHISFADGTLWIKPGKQRPDNPREHRNHGPASMNEKRIIRYLEDVDNNEGMHYLEIQNPSAITAITDGANNLIGSYEMKKMPPEATTKLTMTSRVTTANGFMAATESQKDIEDIIRETGINPGDDSARKQKLRDSYTVCMKAYAGIERKLGRIERSAYKAYLNTWIELHYNEPDPETKFWLESFPPKYYAGEYNVEEGGDRFVQLMLDGKFPAFDVFHRWYGTGYDN